MNIIFSFRYRYKLTLCTCCILLTTAIHLTGCSNSHKTQQITQSEYQTLPDTIGQNFVHAAKLNAYGVELLDAGKLEDSHQAFKDALTADITHGPAHNNLGKVYYLQAKYYLAAWEFQYAAKLMPHQPEPLNNLGLVFESVGKLDAAAQSYSLALSEQPDNPELIGNLARVYYRRGDRDDRVRSLLTDLLLRDTRPEWISWAREKLTLMGGPINRIPDAHHGERMENHSPVTP